MRILSRFDYKIDFMAQRYIALAFSIIVMVVSLGSLAVKGLAFGIDFTGGTLIEVTYTVPVELNGVREALHKNGFPDAVVQHFGTTHDVLIRLGLHKDLKNDDLSNQILKVLRAELGDKVPTSKLSENKSNTIPETATPQTAKTKPLKVTSELAHGSTAPSASAKSMPSEKNGGASPVEMRRIEFVGAHVGSELIEDGGLAVLYTLIGILLYVAMRYEFRFALGAVLSLLHDPIMVLGVFSLTQMEFDLTVVAAILAVMGYSINDTIVVYDRIRDNFLKLRKNSTIEVMNISINQTLSRTVMTSVCTLLVVVVLFFIGGELIRGFSAALIVGIVIGTYSSIYVTSALALALGVSRADLLPVQKEGADIKLKD